MPSITRRKFLKSAALSVVMAECALGNRSNGESPAPKPTVSPAQPTAKDFDYVIAGAGHNSLVCAAYLAKAGYRVLVLEGRTMTGGGCKTTEILLPGFKEDLCSSVHVIIDRSTIIRDNELGLEQYGYELLYPDAVLHFPFLDGASITIYRDDVNRTAATIEKISKKDAATFRWFAAEQERLARMTPAQFRETRTSLYLHRLSGMTGYAAARELWESRHVRAACLSSGRFFGPAGGDIGTGLQALMLMEHMKGRPVPKGGSGMLTVALGRLIEHHGGVILTGKPVGQLIIEDGRCKGVECVDGSQFRADKGVVSTIHVKHLVKMAPLELWGQPVLDTVEIMQPEMAMFQFHFALSEPPKYPNSDGESVSSCEASIMENPESIFALNLDDARGELHLDDYPLQIVHPAVVDSSRVPPGYGLLKIEGSMPYRLKEGPEHWDAIKDQVADTIVANYFRHTTNLTKDKILARFILSPLDVERMNPAMWRGSAHHFDNRFGSFAPCKMPIPGLYQTGACTAPGGSISGLPGRNTADVILKDQKRNIEQVIAEGRATVATKPSTL
jgi:phytoene dehydrogenase-like protein